MVLELSLFKLMLKRTKVFEVILLHQLFFIFHSQICFCALRVAKNCVQLLFYLIVILLLGGFGVLLEGKSEGVMLFHKRVETVKLPEDDGAK